MGRSSCLLVVVAAGAWASLPLAGGPALAQDMSLCRRGHFTGYTREYFEAMEYVGEATTRLDDMVVYVTWDGKKYYMQSNFKTRCPSDTSQAIEALREKARDGQALTKVQREFLENIGKNYEKIQGSWYFRHPTKILTDLNDPMVEQVKYLVYWKTMEYLNERKYRDAFENSISFIVNANAKNIDLAPARNVRVVDVDRSRVGIICDRRRIPGYEQDYEDAVAVIGDDTTTRFDQGVVFINLRPDGRLYLQSNFRPTLPGGRVAPFPVKLATRGETDVFFLASQMFFFYDVPEIPVNDRFDPKFVQFFNAYTDKIRFVVNPAARQNLDFKDAARVEDQQ